LYTVHCPGAVGELYTCILLSLPPAPLLPPSADRLKGIAGAALQTGGELADNDIIAAVADAAANQITADDDATVGERIGMLAGDVTAAVVDSGLIENEQALTVIKAVGDVVQEQAEMDPDASAGTRRHALTFQLHILYNPLPV